MAKVTSILLLYGFLVRTEAATSSIEYIGTIEGKTFVAQISPKKTWNEARQLCMESDMHLASITSVQQRSLLVQAHNNNSFHGHFWTGGRDAQTQSQLVWDHDQSPLNKSVVAAYWHGTQISTCMIFYPKPTFGDYVFDSIPCEQKHGFLCEIVHC